MLAETKLDSREASACVQGQKSAKVVHFHRRPFPGQHSIEILFENMREAMQAAGTAIEVAKVPYFSKGLRARVANARWAARNQGDVNHITGDVHYLALALDSRRTILTVHDCFALERLCGLKRWLLKRYWFDLPVDHVAAVTVVSEETRRELIRYVPAAAAKTIVIPNAVSPMFRPTLREFCRDRPRILQIGTTPNKNLARLFAALEGLSCELHIVGRLPDTERSQLAAARIAYFNSQDLTEQEMFSCYCDADVICFASTYEGFGMPIVEAQWVERPVITSNRSSMPEVAGDGACLVDPFDVASIRRGIDRVIGDHVYREQLVDAGRTNRERFSLQAVADQYLELYRAVRSDRPNVPASLSVAEA